MFQSNKRDSFYRIAHVGKTNFRVLQRTPAYFEGRYTRSTGNPKFRAPNLRRALRNNGTYY